MTFPTVVAFAVGDTYCSAALRLLDDLSSFGHRASAVIGPNSALSAHMERIPADTSARRWTCRFTPSFILSQLDELGTDVLYLHADFRVRRPIPDVFAGLDIGLQRRWFWRPETSKLPVLAAPIYARDNERSRRFLRVWEALCLNVDDGNFEHAHLVRTWELARDLDRTCRVGLFPENIGSVAADADCAIVGHKR